MGSLRTEPKVKSFLSDEEYQSYLKNLKSAQGVANDHNVFFDLEPSENPAKVRKAFVYVAEQEGIPLTVRRLRGKNSLSLSFKAGVKASSSRMSAEECRQRIITVLKEAEGPMQKSEIIKKTGISPSTWNLRVKELIKEKKVRRQGERRDTKYVIF